jgi:hypothetical protein
MRNLISMAAFCLTLITAFAGLVGSHHALAADKPVDAIATHLVCETYGRTKACPDFINGFIDDNPYLRQAPRSDAQLVMFVTTTSTGLNDQLHFRVVSTVAKSPAVLEVDALLNTRGTDDELRAALLPAFNQVVSLFISSQHPEAVSIAFSAAKRSVAALPKELSPWGYRLSVEGSGSQTARYASYNGYAQGVVSRVTARSIARVSLFGNYSADKAPPLMIGDQVVSLNTKAYDASLSGFIEHHLNDCWSLGFRANGSGADKRNQTRASAGATAGVEWDRYASDDPRGNQLAVAYSMGPQYERYNVLNVLSEKSATYMEHTIGIAGQFRSDHIQYYINAGATSQMFAPTRRYSLSMSPSMQWQLGDHVDLNLSVRVVKRAVPGPAQVDETDPDAIARSSYAEPLEIGGSLGVSFHWDATNGQRNNRFSRL